MPTPPDPVALLEAGLVIIDVQVGFDDSRWGPRNNPHAESNMARLLAAWRAAGRPVIHVQHHSTEPDSPLHPNRASCAIKPIVAPRHDEPLFHKTVNSAFIGTDLETYLREMGIETVVFVGLTTDHCVSTSARMAANLGFRAYVVADATATFDRVGHDGLFYPADTVQALALASLHGEFATVIEAESLLRLVNG